MLPSPAVKIAIEGLSNRLVELSDEKQGVTQELVSGKYSQACRGVVILKVHMQSEISD